MVVLNNAKQNMALLLGGSSTDYPKYFMIGSGSGVALASQTVLISPTDRQAFTATDANTNYKVKWTADWNSVEMSGLSLKEFGVTGSGVGTSGLMWSRASIPAIQFDGTNELRIEETWEVF